MSERRTRGFEGTGFRQQMVADPNEFHALEYLPGPVNKTVAQRQDGMPELLGLSVKNTDHLNTRAFSLDIIC